MSDPTNENAGATQPENPPAGEAAPAPEVAAVQAEQPTAVMPPAYAATAGTPPAPPRDAWYRRRWAVIAGAVAAAAILFLGGMAVGTAVGGDDRGEFRGDGGPGMFRDRDGHGFGHEGWGDGGQGMVPPGMGQDGRGFGHDGDGWDGDGYGQPQAPGATPAPVPSQSTTPQSLSL